VAQVIEQMPCKHPEFKTPVPKKKKEKKKSQLNYRKVRKFSNAQK
jgi:hypothetical protein